MSSVWGIATLLVCGFGIGITINLHPDPGLLHFTDAMLLVETEPMPMIAVDWSRLAEIPVLILAAVGIQEMLHRP